MECDSAVEVRRNFLTWFAFDFQRASDRPLDFFAVFLINEEGFQLPGAFAVAPWTPSHSLFANWVRFQLPEGFPVALWTPSGAFLFS